MLLIPAISGRAPDAPFGPESGLSASDAVTVWKRALDAPGAAQLGLLKAIFQGRDGWWRLVPDQGVFTAGGITSGQVLNLAARHDDGRWIMIYLGSKASFSVDMKKVASGKDVKAFWIDPRDVRELAIGTFPNTGERTFSTPDGWEDALLILEASK
jgi:Putative collagen-binding domain of a collagenase